MCPQMPFVGQTQAMPSLRWQHPKLENIHPHVQGFLLSVPLLATSKPWLRSLNRALPSLHWLHPTCPNYSHTHLSTAFPSSATPPSLKLTPIMQGFFLCVPKLICWLHPSLAFPSLATPRPETCLMCHFPFVGNTPSPKTYTRYAGVLVL